MSEPHNEFDQLWLDYREARGALDELLEAATLCRGGMMTGATDEAISRAHAIVNRQDKASALIEAGYDYDSRETDGRRRRGSPSALAVALRDCQHPEAELQMVCETCGHREAAPPPLDGPHCELCGANDPVQCLLAPLDGLTVERLARAYNNVVVRRGGPGVSMELWGEIAAALAQQETDRE